MKLEITFTKLSHENHRVRFTREDGSVESIELETKSFLMHDLIHFCVETEAKLENGFYGSLAKGISYKDIDDGNFMYIEEIVGPLTGVVKGDATPEQFLEGLKNLFDAQEKEIPSWVTLEFVKNVKAKVDELLKKWEYTKRDEVLELVFEI